jgi:hypothetical protein
MIRPGTCEQRRRGIGALEVILILPLLVLVLLAAVEFSAMCTAEDRVSQACREGCRVAACHGDEDSVRRAVEDVLGHEQCKNAKISIKYMNSDDDDHARTGVCVEVILKVPARECVPNYLRICGFDNKDDDIGARCVMRMEMVK